MQFITKATGRNFGLDLVRSLAIFLVLVSHGRGLLPSFPGKMLFANGGYFGVELFFVLSGYLIGGILLKIFSDASRTVGWQQVGNFWIRRWFRTLPNYFLFLILNITLFQWWFGAKPFTVQYFFFLQNFAGPCGQLMPESWSLAVEEWFYLLTPLILLMFSRIIQDRKKAIFTALLSYLLLFTLARFVVALNQEMMWDSAIRKVVIYRLDAIGWGVLVAACQYYYPHRIERYYSILAVVGTIAIIISVALFSTGILTSMESYPYKTILFTLTSVGFAMILPWFQRIKVKSRIVSSLVTHLSVTSYSAYLVHLSFVIPLLARPMFINHLPLTVVYLLYLLLTILLSTVIYGAFELPMTRLRDYHAK